MPGIVGKAIAERYGFECPVVTRTAAPDAFVVRGGEIYLHCISTFRNWRTVLTLQEMMTT